MLGLFAENPSFLVTATYDEIGNGDWSKQQQFYQQLSFHASCNMSSHRPFHRDYFPTKANHRELRALSSIATAGQLLSQAIIVIISLQRGLIMHCYHYNAPSLFTSFGVARSLYKLLSL